MKRADFIRKCMLAGAGASLFPTWENWLQAQPLAQGFKGNVIVIGAGAAGMTAAYYLKKYGISVTLLEASDRYGGRVKRSSDFAEFPLDLGGEWIHDEITVLRDIVGEETTMAMPQTVVYDPREIYNWKNGKLKPQKWVSNFYAEYKFKRSTWYGFFEKYIVPSIADDIRYESPVKAIDYTKSKVAVTTKAGKTYEADKVILTPSVKMMQKRSIQFTPSLPAEKLSAYDNTTMGDGMKLFIKFKERFYPDALLIGGLISTISAETKGYYDAAFKKGSKENILGLFAINEDAAAYLNQKDEEAIVAKALKELDEIFEGRATQNYEKHILQNWTTEPYIQGSYSYDFLENRSRTIRQLAQPVAAKLYFAGEACNAKNQATVHGACASGYDAVARLLET